MKLHASKYKDLKENAVYKDMNDKSPCWIMVVDGKPIVRRQSDGWVKIAPLWELANLTTPDRNHVIDNYVKKGPHDRRLGAGTNGGLWVPADRARTVSQHLNLFPVIREILQVSLDDDSQVPLVSNPQDGIVGAFSLSGDLSDAATDKLDPATAEIFQTMPSIVPRKRGRPPNSANGDQLPKKTRAPKSTSPDSAEAQAFSDSADWKSNADKDFAPRDSPEHDDAEKVPRRAGRPKGSHKNKKKADLPVHADLTDFLEQPAYTGTLADLQQHMRDQGIGALYIPDQDGTPQVYLVRRAPEELANILKNLQ